MFSKISMCCVVIIRDEGKERAGSKAILLCSGTAGKESPDELAGGSDCSSKHVIRPRISRPRKECSRLGIDLQQNASILFSLNHILFTTVPGHNLPSCHGTFGA